MKARLNKRKKAMLEMPQMIQTWKEVRSFVLRLISILIPLIERTWSFLEEVAEIDHSLRGFRDFLDPWRYLYKHHIGRISHEDLELKYGTTILMYNKSAICVLKPNYYEVSQFELKRMLTSMPLLIVSLQAGLNSH